MKINKTLIVGAIVVTLSVIIIGISGSYAFFINTVQEKNSANKGVTVSSGDLQMSFATTNYINATAATLINDDDITTKADYTLFKVTLPNVTKQASSARYELYLTDITMTNNFKSSDVKWALYKGSATTPVNSGTFANVNLTNSSGGTCATYTSGATPVSCNAARINLTSGVTIAKGSEDTYKLYIWLSNATDRNQKDLLQGSLSAKVAFKGVTQ